MSRSSIYQIRVTLNGSKPPIWPKLAVPSDIVLGELHEVIQVTMGWTNSHLHRFDQRVTISKDEKVRLWQKDSCTPREWARLHGGRKFVTKVTPRAIRLSCRAKTRMPSRSGRCARRSRAG